MVELHHLSCSWNRRSESQVQTKKYSQRKQSKVIWNYGDPEEKVVPPHSRTK